MTTLFVGVVLIVAGLALGFLIKGSHARWLDDLDDRQRRGKGWMHE